MFHNQVEAQGRYLHHAWLQTHWRSLEFHVSQRVLKGPKENPVKEKASQWTWALHLHQEASSETL